MIFVMPIFYIFAAWFQNSSVLCVLAVSTGGDAHLRQTSDAGRRRAESREERSGVVAADGGRWAAAAVSSSYSHPQSGGAALTCSRSVSKIPQRARTFSANFWSTGLDGRAIAASPAGQGETRRGIPRRPESTRVHASPGEFSIKVGEASALPGNPERTWQAGNLPEQLLGSD